MEKDIVFFDGTCGFCSARVRWLAAHDRDGHFFFAPLQGSTAASVLHGTGLTEKLSTMVFAAAAGTNQQEIFTESDAGAHIAARLPMPWRLGGFLKVIPRFIRDGVYRWIAERRHLFPSGADACALPTPELQRRLLP